MSVRTLLVTGGSGFIGSSVARVLQKRADVRVVWAVHKTAPHIVKDADRLIAVDVSNPAAIRGIAAGAEAVLHLAHALSGPADHLGAVNADGARAVADEAVRWDARLVTVSTAAVYGPGPWLDAEIHALPEAPRSVISATRAAGDRWIAAAGGTVLRPHFVLGEGDRWVVPRAAAIVTEFGWSVLGAARHSIIGVDELARRAVAAALDQPAVAGVVLAADSEPRLLRPFVAEYLRRTGRTASAVDTGLAGALAATPPVDRPRLQHDLDLVGTEHSLRCTCAERE